MQHVFRAVMASVTHLLSFATSRIRWLPLTSNPSCRLYSLEKKLLEFGKGVL